jgi:hypothetical protein
MKREEIEAIRKNYRRNWSCVDKYDRWFYALMQDEQLDLDAARSVKQRKGVDIRMVAMCIANEGTHGFYCFPGAAYVANMIGCSEDTIERCRDKLIELGWFNLMGRHGGRNNRSLIMDIAIPKGASK